MKFTVEIETGNDAVSGLRDISGLLKKVADKVKDLPNVPDGGKIMDTNGQSVGTWDYKRDD